MELRPAVLDDADAIRAIYNREVTMTTSVFDLVPRSLAEQRAWLAEHAGAHPCVVAVNVGSAPGTDEVIGFGSLSPYRDRPAYSTTVEDSVYVHPDHQGRGVGRALLAELVALAERHGFHAVIGRIVGHNEASISLHEGAGFEQVGVELEVGRKFGIWLDVVVVQRLLQPAATP
jgi:L-amino acid N-acyltransferase YncA